MLNYHHVNYFFKLFKLIIFIHGLKITIKTKRVCQTCIIKTITHFTTTIIIFDN